MRTLIVTGLWLLLLAPLAEAQFIDCGPLGDECTETLYGVGNDPPEGPYLQSHATVRQTPGDGSCGTEIVLPYKGQIRIREQDGCVVSATARCPVEIPQIATDSGVFLVTKVSFDLGPLGLLNAGGGILREMGGNLGHRQLSGTCGVSGDECALDSECEAQNAGDVCTSTCFTSNNGAIPCSSENDPACPNLDCRTEIEWDGIGLCTDNATVCTSDDDCSGDDVCFAGFEWAESEASCLCCQSSLGIVCPVLGVVEYPALLCGPTAPPVNNVGTPDWLFAGGRGTPFEHETIQVPGQQEGVCNANHQRPCGALGDFWAGAANGKCIGDPPCPDPVIGDPTQGAEASTCDDIDFGGIAGDFCDLSEDFIRTEAPAVNPDGTQVSTFCPEGAHLVGTPGALCALPLDIPEGDPQPGCRLTNIGLTAQPDLDCNEIEDTTEGRCMPDGGAICSDPALCPPCTNDGDCTSGNCINNGDLCPFLGELNRFLDSNNDDIGDECQCGDGTGDGAISSPDIAASALCANGAAPPESCDATLLDATGDNATTAEDIGGIVATVNGTIQPSDLQCVRNLDTTQ